MIEHTQAMRARGFSLSVVGNRDLSPSIAVYRPQAELFGGRSDGKSGVRRREGF